jgi:enoyl-CoA hydratase
MAVVEYAVDSKVARITLNRPERGNGLTPELLRELGECVEHADLDPAVHVMLLSGNGSGFCGGYDLVDSAEGEGAGFAAREGEEGTPLDPMVIGMNHNPEGMWDAMVDYAMMRRNVRTFMSLFEAGKPVVAKLHGFCVAGGTDLALCSDLVIAASDTKIGYPPARVWGSPTTSLWAHRIGVQRAKRLLLTGDSISGKVACEWGLACEAPEPAQLDERAEQLVARVARMPLNQLMMMKLLTNQTIEAQGLRQTQVLGTVLDGITRHTKEGYDFQTTALTHGFREAVRQRDEPFGDFGLEGFKGKK